MKKTKFVVTNTFKSKNEKEIKKNMEEKINQYLKNKLNAASNHNS
ncbi:hypothetical protein V6615_07655 [Oscillospiraceae bacterium PP1C4]